MTRIRDEQKNYQYKGFPIYHYDNMYHIKIRDVISGRTHKYQRPNIHELMRIIDDLRRFETLPEAKNRTTKSRFWNSQLKPK